MYVWRIFKLMQRKWYSSSCGHFNKFAFQLWKVHPSVWGGWRVNRNCISVFDEHFFIIPSVESNCMFCMTTHRMNKISICPLPIELTRIVWRNDMSPFYANDACEINSCSSDSCSAANCTVIFSAAMKCARTTAITHQPHRHVHTNYLDMHTEHILLAPHETRDLF